MADDTNAKKKVLIVDDDEFLLNMYAIKLKNSGYEPETATSAGAALDKIKNGGNYDVLIFDVVMPAMNGFEMVEAIKKNKQLTDAVFIALTNQSQAADIERGKKLGIDGYIVKASSVPSEVVKEIKTILDAKGNH